MKVRFAAAIAVAVLLIAGAASATDCVNYQDYLRIVGGALFSNEVECLVVEGDVAYVGGNHTGQLDVLFAIVDCADPLHITTIGSTLLTDWKATSLAIHGDYAYFGSGGQNYPGTNSHLWTVDIADPSAPQMVGVLPLSAWPRDLVVHGDLLLIANETMGLRIFDISNPVTPLALSQTAVGGRARSVAALGRYVYVGVLTEFDDLIVVYDLIDPAAPVLVDSWGGHFGPSDMRIDAGYLYVADGNNGLYIYDLSTPAHPVQVANPTGSMVCEALILEGERLYTAGFGSGLKIWDVAAPADPQLIGQLRLPQDANGLGVAGGHAILMGSDLMVVDVSNPVAASLAATAPQPTDANDFDVVGGLAYLTKGSEPPGVLEIWDVDEPADVHLVGQFSTPGLLTIDVVVDGDRAYLSALEVGPGLSLEHLISLDVSDPAQITALGGEIEFPGYGSIDMAIGGDYLYCINDYSLLHVVDISDPTDLSGVATVETLALGRRLRLVGNHLYIADDYFGVEIYDVTTPAAPVLVGHTASLGDCQDILVDGEFAYLAGSESLYVLDVSNPALPTVVGQGGAEAGMAFNSIALREGRLYGSFGAGIEVFDVSEPAQPTMVGTLSLPWYSGYGLFDLADCLLTRLTDGLGYVALDCNSITAVPAVPAARAGVEVWPNPANPQVTLRFHLAATATVQLDLYDPLGRLVVGLANGRYPAGEHLLTWDGLDAEGRPAPSGAYLARLVSQGELLAAGKLILLR